MHVHLGCFGGAELCKLADAWKHSEIPFEVK